MRRRIGIILLVLVGLVGMVVMFGCSQFSTKPPDIPRVIKITDESFEQAYVLRTMGTPTTIELDYRASEWYIEMWDYPSQGVMVMFVVEGERYKVKTYRYGVGVE